MMILIVIIIMIAMIIITMHCEHELIAVILSAEVNSDCNKIFFSSIVISLLFVRLSFYKSVSLFLSQFESLLVILPLSVSRCPLVSLPFYLSVYPFIRQSAFYQPVCIFITQAILILTEVLTGRSRHGGQGDLH